MNPKTILIVDDDDVLGQILTRVLVQQGYRVERATDATQALQQARQHKPQLALLDLCLPDQDGIELGQKLRSDIPSLPLILMTAYPLSLREQPERVRDFACVLTKPLNLQELRQAVEAALGGTIANVSRPAGTLPDESATPGSARMGPPVAPPTFPTPEVADRVSASNAGSPRRRRRWASALVAVAVLAVVVVGGLWLLTASQGLEGKLREPTEADLHAELVPGQPDSIRLPAAVAAKLGIQTRKAEKAKQPRLLHLNGSLALNSNHLATVHTRFSGEVVEMGQFEVRSPAFTTQFRPVQFDDRVTNGQLLAVVWSKDLGEKKSELVDALDQKRLDEENLKRLEELYRQGAVPEVQVRTARRAFSLDLNAIARAERTLRVWRVPETEIQAVIDEARKIAERKGVRDQEKEKNWARVEVRAPLEGVIVEMNTHIGDIVDTSKDLFKVANTETLTVWANAYEEDLPTLRALPEGKRRWTLQLNGEPNARPLQGTFGKPSPVLDANQHTALIMGTVDNPGGRLAAGQFVTATVALPPLADAVAVPASALVENGQVSILFIQADREKPVYTQRRVQVVQRTHDIVYIRWFWPEGLRFLSAFPLPTEPVLLSLAGLFQAPDPLRSQLHAEEEFVVTSGALLLKAGLEDLQTSSPPRPND